MILTPDYHFYSRVAFNNEVKIEIIVIDNLTKSIGDYSLLLAKTRLIVRLIKENQWKRL